MSSICEHGPPNFDLKWLECMCAVFEIAQERSAFDDENGVSAGNEATTASQQETPLEPGSRVFLVTAHHADDQIETILLKMVRYPPTGVPV